MKSAQQATKELTLMLLYLQSWQEQPARMRPSAAGHCSWKGYDFDILNELDAEGLIYDDRHSKLVTLDDSGIEKAKLLLLEYGILEDGAQ